ncbi:acyl-CoA dehydrogenase [Actinocorallia sp. API 0066]|uniref:acyl-CoA dehydrogenase n=1 Tax=Actinocorallia sp. API 0066 TaxID=2896846 RepID=UPI001E2CFFB2|nr:acyl-CoA dehydrogenase [Actinocorallia sp. API 0066]MCD0448928.1 acyl-CoA dehydrogenase [Actinocorallia sp. API 0066]
MAIGISEEHRALAETAADFLRRRDALGAARGLLDAPDERPPAFWPELSGLGWPGLHLPEAYGGAGFGLGELVVVIEELGRAVAPGPFVPTAVVSAFLAEAAPEELKAELLPGFAEGTLFGAAALDGAVTIVEGRAEGDAGAAIGGGLAHVLLVAAGEDVAVVRADAPGVTVEAPPNLDPTRRTARITLRGARVVVLPGGRAALLDLARVLFAAEATGLARACTEAAAAYAKIRVQFGRPIATFQAVKHHCANMLVAAEMATAAVWDAARATEPAERSYTAAMAAALALPAAQRNGQLNMQVHGGIGFTWEHDAHLYIRRAETLAAVLSPDAAAADVTAHSRAGVTRTRTVELPAAAEVFRAEIRAFADKVKDLDEEARRAAMVDEGYAVPHWRLPWGRNAKAVEQLVIEEEFKAAGLRKPAYGITGWVLLTLAQHATEEQIARWIRPGLLQEVLWCQLFSEPDAGSDAAGVRTRAVRTDGGWILNGQKVWTSGAHQAAYGLATVRTDPAAPKHQGITTVVIDMNAPGVRVRPLRQATGGADFNEVFFTDVFVPDADVVGPVHAGWTVARATLGNESVSIGGQSGMSVPHRVLLAAFDAHPGRLDGGAARLGRHLAADEAIRAMNLRTAHRAVTGGGPGPEGNVAKLVMTENGHEASAILAALGGPDTAFAGGDALTSGLVLWHRAMAIAGGTSEIKRNQIAERILGLPRDPLIR